jgi:SAM-dependent MidA family methyltransferase
MGAAMLTVAPPPPPDADEIAHGARVAAALRARIAAGNGWMPFREFMETALYAPGLGYYVTTRALFGAAGDFVTAPELSPLFAACLANGVAGVLAKTDGGDIVEFGAGSGVLAVELLPALQRLGAEVARYRIVEPSPVLAARQRERIDRDPRLADLRDRFEWLEAAPARQWQGVAIANEVVDALPVDRFRVTAGGCEAIGVIEAGDAFAFAPGAADAALAAAVALLQGALPVPMPAGYVSELRPGQRGWLAGAAQGLSRGAILVVDYGLPRAQYYHPSRDGGTLCGFRRHRRVADALADPGLQDLTAWVDYSALAEDGLACGLVMGGFATQAHYLLDTGIERELARLAGSAGDAARRALKQDAATLLLPGEMGERFKAMVLAREICGPFPGFGFRDLAVSL